MMADEGIRRVAGPIAPSGARGVRTGGRPSQMTYSVYLGDGRLVTSPEGFPDASGHPQERQNERPPAAKEPPSDRRES